MAFAVALFRAPEDADRTSAALAERGIGAAPAPVLAFVGLDPPPPEGSFDFAIATSAKAITLAPPETLAFAARLPWRVVGERTAEAARRAGFHLDGPIAAEVADLLPTLPTGRALYLTGRDRKPALEEALGARATPHVVYEAQARASWSEAETLSVASAAAALHYSARSAEIAARLAEQAGIGAAFRRLSHVCLSRDVARPLAAMGAGRILWPQVPGEEALLDTLETALGESRL